MAQQAIKTPADGLDAGGSEDSRRRRAQMPAYYGSAEEGGQVPGHHRHSRGVRTARVSERTSSGAWRRPAISRSRPIRSSGSGDLSKVADVKQVIASANTLTDAQAFADLDALVAWVEKQPKANANKLGITGMCRGGRTVWMYTAHNPKIKAGVAWYGQLTPAPPGITTTPMDITDKLNAPVLGLYGGADGGIPLNHVERMRAGLLAFGKDKDSLIIVYDGMPHALPRRLPEHLPQGSGRGRLEAHARLVQEARRRVIAGFTERRVECRRRGLQREHGGPRARRAVAARLPANASRLAATRARLGRALGPRGTRPQGLWRERRAGAGARCGELLQTHDGSRARRADAQTRPRALRGRRPRPRRARCLPSRARPSRGGGEARRARHRPDRCDVGWRDARLRDQYLPLGLSRARRRPARAADRRRPGFLARVPAAASGRATRPRSTMRWTSTSARSGGPR